MKRLHLLCLLSSLFLASCGVQHTPATKQPRIEAAQQVGSLSEQITARLQQSPAYAPILRGSIQAEIRLGKEQLATKINATIQRGEVIYWSIVPFPLIEAARVWFTQTGITAIDRMHGRYAEVSYEELSSLLGFPLHYSEVEQLLLGKPFFPEEAKRRSLSSPSASAERSATATTDYPVSATLRLASGQVAGRYLLEWLLDPLLQPTRFSVQREQPTAKEIFSLRYTHSEASQAKSIPLETALYLGASSSGLPALTLDWGKMRPSSGTLPDLTPRIKAGYQRMTLPELIKLLPSL